MADIVAAKGDTTVGGLEETVSAPKSDHVTNDAKRPGNNEEATESKDDKERIDGLLKIDNLAAAQYRNGNFKEAADLLRRALQIREQFLPKDDIDLLNNLNNLAAALGRLRQFDEAESLFRRVLAGREEKLGKDHMDTLVTANHLGVIIKQQFKLTDAEQLLVRALEGLSKIETAMPANALLYAEASYNYAVLCVQLGKRRTAAKYFRIAHKRLESSLGGENPHTLDALHWEIKCTKDVDFVPTSPTAASSSASGDGVKESEEEMYLSKPTWVNAPNCELCNRQFTTLTMVRPHHCRICARTVCDQCSKGKTVTKEFGLTTPVRCCDMCEQQGF